FHNRLTANGERFNQYALTAAHPKLPFNTYLRVTNVRSGASVIVRINDRGPYVGQRSLDLSRQSARCIGSEKPGVVRYEAVILEPQTTVQ
ncbi:MAG: septal ring lytic transglycosylase RlpA family protein, partial [Cyanobacteriota bacterium]